MANIEEVTYIVNERGMYKKGHILKVDGKDVEGEEVDHTYITTDGLKKYTETFVEYTRDGFKPNNEEMFKKRIFAKRRPDPNNDGWYTLPKVFDEEMSIEDFEIETNMPKGTGKHVRELRYLWNGELSVHLYTNEKETVKKVATYVDNTEPNSYR